MYLNLGKTKINYFVPKVSDFTIIAQVTSSSMSYEKPVLVSTADELLVWFGTGYKEEDYYQELLKNGVVLYLTKQISSIPDKTRADYVDYSRWIKVGVELSVFHRYTSEFAYIIEGKEYTGRNDGLLEINNENLKLPVYNGFSSLPKKGEPGKLYVMIDSSYWIWLNEEWIKTSELPQNIEDFRSESRNNRDTLLIYDDWTYATPEFVNNCPENLIISLEGLDYERVEEGYQTLAFDIEFGDETGPGDNDYLILPNAEGRGVLIYFVNEPKKLSKYYPGGAVQVSPTNWKEGLLNILEILGYQEMDGTLYCKKPIQTTYFYEMSNGFRMIPSYLKTHSLIEKYKGKEPILRLWSKTIGSGGDDGKIKVTLNQDYIEISRFGYVEVIEFEGGLDIISAINNNSKLVYCSGKIPKITKTKSYYLNGSVKENNRGDYRKSLKTLIGEGEIKPDFVLIESLTDLEIESPEDPYWKTLLEYSSLSSCQFLIQNTREDYRLNYILDKENRLVYFYDKMYMNGRLRPGYYAFLYGILSDRYSISMTELSYDSPIKDSNEEIDGGGLTIYEKDLELRKSNYLMDNGLSYYYKSYQEGENPTSSILMRFVLGKITRQIHKSRWEIYSSGGAIENALSTILKSIKNAYSIVRSITLTNISTNKEHLNVSIETRISDLVKSNVSLDIEINYNKFN